MFMDFEWIQSLKALFPDDKRVIIRSVAELEKLFYNKMYSFFYLSP